MKYDVFISCKSEDYKLAEEIYDYLESVGIHTFLASKELRQLADSEYRRSITKALESAYHMIIFASKAEYIESEWVYYEWDMFINAKLKKKKEGQIVTILNGVRTDDINIALWKYESFTIDDYKEKILSYIETPNSIKRKVEYQTTPSIGKNVGSKVEDFIQEGFTITTKDSINTADYDKIDSNTEKVCFANKDVPIIFMYGPSSVGKTMTIVRLARFLTERGYTILPNRTFRPSCDKFYQDICTNFQELVNSGYAAGVTDRTGILLIDVIKKGNVILQILDTPGVIINTNKDEPINYPIYFNDYINSSNPKIWMIFLEPYWADSHRRMVYTEQVCKLKYSCWRESDSALVIYNKIDQTSFVTSLGKIVENACVNDIKQLYPGMLDVFKNQHFPSRMFRKYTCSILPFQTGVFKESKNGNCVYSPGPIEYVDKLWKEIEKII